MVNKYHQSNKENLQKEAREMYQNFSEEEKEKRRKNVWDSYKNLFKKKTEESDNIIGIEIRIFLKRKNKRKLSI